MQNNLWRVDFRHLTVVALFIVVCPTYGRQKKKIKFPYPIPLLEAKLKSWSYINIYTIYQIWEIYLRLFIVAGLYYILHTYCLFASLTTWIESRGYFGSSTSTSTYWSVSWVIWVRAMLRFYYWEPELRFM